MTTLTTVAVYHTLPEALIAQSFLRAHGVTAFLPEQYYAAAAWHHIFAIQGIRLCTPDVLAETARNLLNCREDDDVPARWPPVGEMAFAFAILYLFGIPHPPRRETFSPEPAAPPPVAGDR